MHRSVNGVKRHVRVASSLRSRVSNFSAVYRAERVGSVHVQVVNLSVRLLITSLHRTLRVSRPDVYYD